MPQQTYQVTHSSFELKTVGEYVDEINSPAHLYKKNSKERDFLLVKDEDGVTNEDRINLLLSEKEKEDNKGKEPRDKKIKVGTIFHIPVTEVEVSGLITQGIEVVSNDIPSFKAEQLLQIENDKGYEKVDFYNQTGQELQGRLKIQYPEISVWIWCRSLSRTFNSSGEVAEQEGEMFDLTPFIQSLTTNVGKNGGNFQLKLPPLVCKIEDTSTDPTSSSFRWVLDRDNLSVNENGDFLQNNSIFYGPPLESIYEDFGDSLKRSKFLFHNIISSNDLIFIRFETLKMEEFQRREDEENFYADKTRIAERLYDMIGLVDTNSLTFNSQNNDVQISVTGRDLIKLFIDDGVYFYNLENITGNNRIAGESTSQNTLTKRLVGDNILYYLHLYQNNSIQNVLQFIINQLSTISVIPDNLLESYGERRNKRFVDKSVLIKQQQQNESIEEKKKKVILLIDKIVKGPSDSKLTFSNLYFFLKQIRDRNKRITNGKRTLGWESFTTSQQETLAINEFPNFFYTNNLVCDDIYYSTVTKEQIRLVDVINEIDDILDQEQTQTKGKDENRYDETLAKGIWQIIKLVIDRNVTERRIVDSSMSSANGSLLNFIKKICQEPFVEFYSDTYGDMFYLIVRKLPFDSIGIRSMLKGEVETEKGTPRLTSPVININSEDVIREELSFDDREVYSWYSFKPQNVYMSGGNLLPAAYTPSIYFEEYAKIWGSRPLDLVHNYNPYQPLFDQDKGVADVSRYETQAILDLKYVIESHAYLPFTRKGTITLNGDRRLKRGNLVRYTPTSEIFHIDSVSHSFQISDSTIERTTTIQVSRGMVELFIYGVTGRDLGMNNSQTLLSYFNIINTDFKIETKQFDIEEEEEREVKIVKQKLVNNNNETTTQGEEFLVKPGFNEYIQHQQGMGGAKAIIQAAKTNTSVSSNIEQNMRNQKIEGSFVNGILTPRSFLKALIKFYNKKYDETISSTSSLDHYYLQASKETNMKLDSIRTMGYIESSHGKNLGGDSYYGVMQLSKEVAKEFNVDRRDTYQNILGGARYMKRHSKNQLIGSSFIFPPITTNELIRKIEEVEETIIEKIKVKKQYIGVDLDKIYSDLKVNKEVFNFFIRKEQFANDLLLTNMISQEQNRKDVNF